MKETEWRGKALTSEEIDEGKVTSTRWHPKVKYSWACGKAISRFLEEIKKVKLIATKCDKCGRILFPPRVFCEECFADVDEWVYVKDTGTVQTFSISYLDMDAKRIKVPILVGVVSIDGASEKMGIMHYFGDMKPEELKIGMKVKAVWRPANERKGSILDIKHFGPLKEGEQ